jgi:hypothetical protein
MIPRNLRAKTILVQNSLTFLRSGKTPSHADDGNGFRTAPTPGLMGSVFET